MLAIMLCLVYSKYSFENASLRNGEWIKKTKQPTKQIKQLTNS